MPITTGSYPKGLSGGGSMKETPAEAAGDETPYDVGSIKAADDKGFLAAQEKGYSPRKAMAAGMLKAD